MMKILTAYGIPHRNVQAVNVMYCNERAKVLGPDGDTEQSMLLAGVLQRDTLAQNLFIIVLEYAL